MSAGRRFPRALALRVAGEICDALRPVCERLKVCGSLRRGKPDVGDVEFVFIPLLVTVPADFFTTCQADLAAGAIEALVAARTIEPRLNANGCRTWGPQNKLARHVASGLPLDFFSGREGNWWSLVVCRTGPAASNEAICNAAIARGWRWNPYGAGFYDRATGELVHRVSSEEDVFAAVGLPALPPSER